MWKEIKIVMHFNLFRLASFLYKRSPFRILFTVVSNQRIVPAKYVFAIVYFLFFNIHFSILNLFQEHSFDGGLHLEFCTDTISEFEYVLWTDKFGGREWTIFIRKSQSCVLYIPKMSFQLFSHPLKSIFFNFWITRSFYLLRCGWICCSNTPMTRKP